MKRWIQLFCLFAVAATLLSSLLTIADAGQKGAKSGKSAHSAKTVGKKTTLRGDDPNVKHDEAKNSATAKVTQPSQKGGKTRGASAVLHVNNHTKWYIRIYNNGDYIGTVASYGDAYYYAEPGSHTLYARAPFDGNTPDLTWGPSTVSVESTFVWNLY